LACLICLFSVSLFGADAYAADSVVECVNLPLEAGHPSDDGYLVNRNGTCVIDSDINGKLDGNFHLRAGSSSDARWQLIECLEKAGVFALNIGTSIDDRGRRALCECQRKMVREKISCDHAFGSTVTVDDCEKLKKRLAKGGIVSMGFFGTISGMSFGHEVQVTDLLCDKKRNFVGVSFRDPNFPDVIQVGVIDPRNGRFTTRGPQSRYMNNWSSRGFYSATPH
ncbi:MAG: hypothetical protein KDD44_04335, partial [Bdellovibrionales bacterium]|nr:hypothetical protein [Bdellovibrionales bacterium]